MAKLYAPEVGSGEPSLPSESPDCEGDEEDQGAEFGDGEIEE